MINGIIRVYSWQKSSQSLYDVFWAQHSVFRVLRIRCERPVESVVEGWKGAAADPCGHAWPRKVDG